MRNRLLPLGLILLLAGLLTPVLQNFIGETIVGPLLYLLWVGRLIFASIPQVVIWGLFFIIALLIAGRSLYQKQPPLRRIRRPPPPDQGRIERWAKLIHQADQENYYRWQLAQHLRKLTLEAVAHEERLTAKQVQQHLADNKLNLPPDIQAYFQASTISFTHFSEPTRRPWSRTTTSPLDLDPERVVRFLEDKFR